MISRAEDSIPTRQSLLRRLKQGDDATGWQEFFETYWRLVYNVACKAGLNDAEAQDAVQETILVVARNIAEFKTDPRRGSFKSWLLGQARWRIGDQFRARARNTRNVVNLADSPMAQARPPSHDETSTTPFDRLADPASDRFGQMWDEEWKHHILRTAVERIKLQVSVKQFQLFELHVQQGVSVGDTAKTLETSRAAVYMAACRVKRLLKKEIQALSAAERDGTAKNPRRHRLAARTDA